MIRSCSKCGSKNRVPSSKLHETARCGACKAPMSQVDEPVSIHDADAFDALVSDASLPVLVDFWAPWCGPCRMVGPELETLARTHAGRVVVVKLNTDEVPEVAGRYGIRGIPTMILFDKGREARRVSGAMPARAIARQLSL